MPRLSDTMDEGTIAAWLKAEGDVVDKGEALCEIEMDKATLSYDSPYAGVLVRHLQPQGAVVQLGEPIAEIEDK
jgi:pyruvate dehydrogenase E2 component (dihydrolipoamide acetyltransferase)